MTRRGVCRDASVAEHLLELPARTETPSRPSQLLDSDSCWSPERLCAYISWARRTLAPVVTPAAQAILQAYFQHQRTAASMSSGGAGQERVTVRLLEAMVRLSQAHARLLGKAAATAQDATAVVLLMDGCAHVVRVLSQVTGGSGGGGWGLCRSHMSDSELELAQHSLLERLDLTQVKQEGYDTKPMPPGPASAPRKHAVGVAAGQAKAATSAPAQGTQSQGCSMATGPAGSVLAPRGLLARNMGHLGGLRSSAPVVGAEAVGSRPAAAPLKSTSGPSAPTSESPGVCNGASRVPAARVASAPSGGTRSAGPPKHALQLSASRVSGAAVGMQIPLASQGSGSTRAAHVQPHVAAGPRHAAAASLRLPPRAGGEQSAQFRGQGQSHDRTAPTLSASQHAPVLTQRPSSANVGVPSTNAHVPQACDKGWCNSKARDLAPGPRPRADSAPAAPSSHAHEGSQRRGPGHSGQPPVGMSLAGMKRTLLPGSDGPPSARVRASAPAMRFPMDDEEDVDLSEWI